MPRSSSATRSTFAVHACSPSSSTHAAYDSGLVEIVPSTPSGNSADRISARRSVYATRSSLRQSGACTSAFTGCPWNVPCGKPLMVNTYRPSASSQARKSPSRSPSSSSVLSAPDSRRPMPNGASGDRRAFSAGACARRLSCTASQPTAGWMFVQ